MISSIQFDHTKNNSEEQGSDLFNHSMGDECVVIYKSVKEKEEEAVVGLNKAFDILFEETLKSIETSGQTGN